VLDDCLVRKAPGRRQR